MTTIVLVPGAWLGSAAWNTVATPLRTAGHTVHALTLPGLGRRANAAAAQVRLADHVADVLDQLSVRNLSDVALVGRWTFRNFQLAAFCAFYPSMPAQLPPPTARITSPMDD